MGDTVYEGEHIVLATGSVPKSLPGLELDGERVISSDDALTLDRVPSSVIILGGGVIGVRVRQRVDARSAPTSRSSRRCRSWCRWRTSPTPSCCERAFRRRGIGFELGRPVRGRRVHRQRRAPCTLEGGKTLDAELLLVAVGRGPVSADLGYEEAGVAMDRGYVKVDEYCRTSVPASTRSAT